MDDKQRILQEIKRVAQLTAPMALSKRSFLSQSSLKESYIRYHFGTWNDALEAAGFQPNAAGIRISGNASIPDDELLAEIGEVWKKCGRRPTIDLMNSQGKFSKKPYVKRWGTFSQAIEAFVQKFGEPISGDHLKEYVRPKTNDLPTMIPNTYKPVSSTGSRTQVFYGEPIDFRGLRHAPVNEQGVVYLFALVSRELGFLIESIRTDFPDCEGKRCLDIHGSKWAAVKIEFEYKSRNFYQHGHKADDCNLIVCWIHDWEDCPLEVLELKSTISQLPNR